MAAWLLNILSSDSEPNKEELIFALDLRPPFFTGPSVGNTVSGSLVLKSSPSELSESSNSGRSTGFDLKGASSTSRLATSDCWLTTEVVTGSVVSFVERILLEG